METRQDNNNYCFVGGCSTDKTVTVTVTVLLMVIVITVLLMVILYIYSTDKTITVTVTFVLHGSYDMYMHDTNSHKSKGYNNTFEASLVEIKLHPAKETEQGA